MRNNTIYNILMCGVVMVTALTSLSGCSDELTSDLFSSGLPLDIQANVEQNNVTRANDNGFAHNDQIGVFVVNYENENVAPDLQLSGNHADNVCFTYDDNEYKWTGSYQLYWKNNQTPIDVYGYYPFISTLTSITEQPFSVERNQRDTKDGETMSGYEKSDFLWAKAERIMPTDAKIMLKHYHIMAGVEVTLAEGTGFDEGEWAEAEKSVLVQNTVMLGTINLRNGSVAATGTASSSGIIPQESQGKYRAVVLPQSLSAGKALFDITVSGKTMHFSKNETMEYVPGKLHKFTFQVNKTSASGDYELTIISDAIVNWENDPLSHNGAAREYITVNINEGERLKDVLKRMGIEDPSLIKNLKLTGCIDNIESFADIHKLIPYLEAVNLKELRTKQMPSHYSGASWNGQKYGQPEYADDYLPGDFGIYTVEDMTYYGYYAAFDNMAYLQYVVWPDHLKGIGENAFAGCPLRGSLIFPEGLKHIGSCVFDGYGRSPNMLTGELYIPSTVEYIGDNAFSYYDEYTGDLNFTYLTGELVLPSKMKYLGKNAFGRCVKLTGNIIIPDGLEEVNPFAAPNMTGDVIVPQGVKRFNPSLIP